MKKRRVLATLLSLIMLLTLIPATVFADSSTTVGTSGMELTKNVTLEENGTYTIDLEAYATGATTTTTTTTKAGTPLDIVLVIDQSGSMAWNDSGRSTNTATDRRMYKLQQAVKTFANTIAANAKEYNVDHRMAIVGFAGGGESSGISGIGYNGDTGTYINTGIYIDGSFKNYKTKTTTSGGSGGPGGPGGPGGYGGYGSQTTYTDLTSQNYKDALVSVNDGTGNPVASITDAINLFKASGGTYTEYGLILANNVFANNSNTYTDTDGKTQTRKRIVVLFTDGDTNSERSNVLTQANTLKSTYGATVYCVQFGSDSDNTTFLSYVSSNYTKSSYSDGGWFGYGAGYSGTAAAVQKYSFNTTDSSELDNIFTNISKDATTDSSSTSVTLDADSVLKDIISDGFTVPTAAQISVKTYAGTYNAETGVTQGAETATSSSVEVEIDGSSVNISNFNYAEKYIASGHAGEILKITITGILPTDEAATGLTNYTNDPASGIYGKDEEGKITSTPSVAFDRPTTIVTSKAYVIDYAKETELTELPQSSIKGVYGAFQQATSATSYSATYGTVAVKSNKVYYTPTTTNWKGYDKLYVFGTTADTDILSKDANKPNKKVWTKVTVVPANNVYYEDDFTTTTARAGIEYTGTWTATTATGNNTEVANDGVQGWTSSLENDATDTDGSLHESSADTATASFTFSGTGVDIYGRTSPATGTIYAKIADAKGNVVERKIIDTVSYSGTYYQIPACTFENLTYGQYTVTITVTAAAKEEGSRLTYSIDGIRVYNPVQEDATVKAAYGTDEINASFTKVRDLLTKGTVFIDKTADGKLGAQKDYDSSEYGTYGPKNEVYLAKGQSVTFKVTYASSNAYYIGMKAINGTTATVTMGSNKAPITIASAADQYYRVLPSDDGYITVENSGEGILSLTKVKACGTSASITTLATDPDLETETADYYNNTFSTLTSVSYETALAKATATTSDNTSEVVINNPTEETVVATTWYKDIFSRVKKVFGR